MTTPDPIIVYTITDPHTLGCPLCDFTVDVPDVPVSDPLGAVFGMSGTTLALVHAEQAAKTASSSMERHLREHPVLDWLPRIGAAVDGVKCQICGRPRTAVDDLDYNPVQVITGQPIGWYSAEDGEICPKDMAQMVRGQ